MLEVLEAGGLVTMQDAGRPGWRRYGMPFSGPMDAFAFRAANLLVGNPSSAAAVEIGGDVVLRALYDCVIAVTGAGIELSINSWDFPLWGSYFVRGGWQIRLARARFGMWAYLAAAGGFDGQLVLGSRSTYLRGRFGGLDGRPIQAGDRLTILQPRHDLLEVAARKVAEEARPAYSAAPAVGVILGPQSHRFHADDLAIFLSSPYHVNLASDRMGYRLDGARLANGSQSDITSEGMAMGSIQVPADGQPIVMMADCATTGGYAKIACVTSADLPLLAQCTPGRDQVRFRQVTLESAQVSYRMQMDRLKAGIIGAEDERWGG